MTFGIGSLCSASASAFCRPSASVAPGTTLSRNSASALPSGARFKAGTTLASWPSAASFFSSAGVGAPLASSATATGISFCCTAWSAALSATPRTCTASRRGDANGVTTASAAARPWAFRLSASTLAKASPSLFSALGGSSSTNSSTSRLGFVSRMVLIGVLRPPSSRVWAITSSAQARGAIGKPSRARLSR